MELQIPCEVHTSEGTNPAGNGLISTRGWALIKTRRERGKKTDEWIGGDVLPY